MTPLCEGADLMPIVNRIADLHGEITAWRHDIHAHPELLYDVHRTAASVAEKLKSFGCDFDVYGDGEQTRGWMYSPTSSTPRPRDGVGKRDVQRRRRAGGVAARRDWGARAAGGRSSSSVNTRPCLATSGARTPTDPASLGARLGAANLARGRLAGSVEMGVGRVGAHEVDSPPARDCGGDHVSPTHAPFFSSVCRGTSGSPRPRSPHRPRGAR